MLHEIDSRTAYGSGQMDVRTGTRPLSHRFLSPGVGTAVYWGVARRWNGESGQNRAQELIRAALEIGSGG